MSCALPQRHSTPARLLTPLEFSRFTVRTNLTKSGCNNSDAREGEGSLY
jgi:hypothetical protein